MKRNIGILLACLVLSFSGTAMASTWMVDDPTDPAAGMAGDCSESCDGVPSCSLRDAIAAAGPGDTVAFCPGPQTHNLGAVIVLDKGKVTIDGGTSKEVIINGNAQTHNCFNVTSAENVIKGLVIQDCVNGILAFNITAFGNKFQSNFIGTDASGTTSGAGIANDTGLLILASSDNIVGTDGDGVNDAAEENVISGNLTGVSIRTLIIGPATRNRVQGNFIGTDASGKVALANTYGVFISESPGNFIGGTAEGARNVISGNLYGVALGNGAVQNQILGNFIGTDISGTKKIGNTTTGILINASSDNTIGGSVSDTGNVISGNGNTGANAGIQIENGASLNKIEGNFIGTDKTKQVRLSNSGYGIIIDNSNNNTIGETNAGSGNIITNNVAGGVEVIGSAVGNAILSNSIFANAPSFGILNAQQPGIDLLGDDITLNDGLLDPDLGPNNLQNFPSILSVESSDASFFDGEFESAANTDFRLEFFSNTRCDKSGYGEGETYLGFTTVTTGANGAGTFQPTLTPVPTGQPFVTATATEMVGGVPKSTSEFSPCVQATFLPYFEFAEDSYSVNEQAGSIDVVVKRVGAVFLPAVTVNLQTLTGTAAADLDYTAFNQPLNFDVGVTSVTATIKITDDADAEGNEALSLSLSAPSLGVVGTKKGSVSLTIVDNETCPNGTIDAGEDCEGNNLGGKGCVDLGLGFDGGDLSCGADCKFVTTACTTPSADGGGSGSGSDDAGAGGDGAGGSGNSDGGAPNPPSDTDADGIFDDIDTDDDNDGVPDTSDAFPLDPSKSSEPAKSGGGCGLLVH